ncbi:MAG: RecX family transcriptional regulator [Candidatus Limiplasma sp.]|nr:RecX family transcriptional regulator [Candidatus Limiplasma sp.]
MKDVVAAVEESKRGAVVRFESGERLWFGRTAWLERSPLRPGDVEDVDDLKQWLLPRQYPQALGGAVRLLAARARSTGEIRQKLEAYGYMDDTVDMVLYKLEKEGLVDDEAFACEWAVARARHQIGRVRILRELAQKGVNREIAERAVEALDEEEGDAAAVALAQKLLRRYADEADAKKAMAKLMAAMARRGYDFESARQAVERALEEARGE